MNENIEWPGAIYFLAILLYIVIIHAIRRIERRKKGETPLSDEEYLTHIARQNGCSEYDIFGRATEAWRISKDRAARDFDNYLKSGVMPYYVKDYVRKKRDETRTKD